MEILIKEIKPILVASIKEAGKKYEDFQQYFNIIYKDLTYYKIKESGNSILIKHNNSNYFEACVPIERKYISDHPKIEIKILPSVKKMAYFIHKGPLEKTASTHIDNFLKLLKENHIKYHYPHREIYISSKRENPNWFSFVTEFQFPLE